MWLLIATLCIQTSATDAECRRDVRGPYLDRKACRDLERPLEIYLEGLAADLGAPVLFVKARCEKGDDL
jgi:hypothetical protein